MAAVQAIMIPNSQGIRTLEVNSPRSGSPPSLTYSPGSVGTLSSSASSPSAVSLKTASSSLSTPTTPDSTEQTVRKRPSFIRRKPVPRLTLEEELALLDDESRRLDNSIQTTPVIPGYGLLPALELLAKQKAELPVRPLFSVVPDPPSFAMTRSDVKTLKPSITPKIVATTENEEPHSPIPPESPSVSEVAIQWYTTPVSDKTNNKRFRIPSDAAEACGSPEMKCGAPASCRSTLVETLHVPEEETEHTSAQLSEYDSDELDEEKRASILTDTFDPRGHTHRCTTGRCSIGSVALDSQHDGSDNDTDDESRDYVSIIPVPILRKARSTDSQVAEETDFLDESVRLSEYRWLPKRFVDPKDGRKRTCQSYSTTNTETFPRSRTPTYEQDAISFVTAQELPRTPSMLHEEETFATPHISTVAQPPRAFLSTSPSLASSRSDSISSNAATIDSDLYNDRSSVFESPNVRAGLFIRESIQSSSSDSAVDAYRATLPGRKISLSASPGGSYTTATMRWDRNLSMSQKEGTMVTRRPSTADNPCYVNVVPPPPVNYQNKRPHTAPVTSQKDESRTSHGMPQSRSKAFALVMRELLALHEASIRARHEAARIKAEKRAAAKQALQLYTYQRPETEAMEQAADCMVYTSTGKEVRFGDLYEGARTIVCFIRHYW